MGIESMVVIGHSFGGYVGSEYALKYSAMVDHLCLMEPWGMYPEEEDTIKSRYWMIEELFGIIKFNALEVFRAIGNERIGELLLIDCRLYMLFIANYTAH